MPEKRQFQEDLKKNLGTVFFLALPMFFFFSDIELFTDDLGRGVKPEMSTKK